MNRRREVGLGNEAYKLAALVTAAFKTFRPGGGIKKCHFCCVPENAERSLSQEWSFVFWGSPT
jgi:hypothetical protein